MVVHQLVPSFRPGDAMGAAALAFRQLLRRLGHAGEVYAGEVANGFESLVHPAGALRPGDGDLVLYHHGIASPLAARMQLWPTKVGVVFHNVTPARFYVGTRLEEPLRAGRAQLSALARTAAFGIGVSALNVRELKASGFERAFEVPLAVEPERFDPERADPLFARELERGGHPLVLSVGRVVPHKRVEDLLALHAELRAVRPSARLLVVGKGDEGHSAYQALRAKADALGGVTFAGTLSHAELVAAYRAADVYASMSEHEGFGVPLVEAMAADLPVLAFGAAAVPETLGGHGVVFTEKRFAALAELVCLLVEDDRFKARVLAGQRERLEALSPAAAEAALARALEVVASPKPTPTPKKPAARASKAKPKVAFVVQRFGEDITGGAEAHARAVALRLAEHAQISVLTTTASDHLTWANTFPAGRTRDGALEVKRFRVARERRMRSFNRLSDERLGVGNDLVSEEHWLAEQGPLVPGLHEHLAKEGRGYDAVAFFTYLYAPTAWGVGLVKDRALVVPTAHDEPPLKLDVFQDVFTLPRALLCNTPEEVELVRQRAPHAARCRVVGVGVEPLKGKGERFAKRFGIDGPWLLYVGRVEAGKGLPALLAHHKKLVAKFHDAPTLVVAGAGDYPVKGERVRAVGRISEEDKWDALAGALGVVVPSQYESLSLLALEGFAAGTPLLANAMCSVLSGHVERSGAGATFVDAQEYIDGVRQLGASRVAWGERAKVHAKQYRWSKVIDAWREEIAWVQGANT